MLLDTSLMTLIIAYWICIYLHERLWCFSCYSLYEIIFFILSNPWMVGSMHFIDWIPFEWMINCLLLFALNFLECMNLYYAQIVLLIVWHVQKRWNTNICSQYKNYEIHNFCEKHKNYEFHNFCMGYKWYELHHFDWTTKIVPINTPQHPQM